MEKNQTFPSSMETTIRSFERSDLDSIEDIERRSFNDPWSRSEFESFHQRDSIRFLVAVRNAKVVGYVIVEVVKTMDPLKLRLIKRGHLLNIAVDPKHRHYSVGKTMVDASIRYLRKESTEEIWLEVRGSNSIAKRFYLKMGFKETGRKNQYYLTEDALVMKKEL